VRVRVVQLAEVDLPRYIRERSIQATPDSARSIRFLASHAWISTSEAPRIAALERLHHDRRGHGLDHQHAALAAHIPDRDLRESARQQAAHHSRYFYGFRLHALFAMDGTPRARTPGWSGHSGPFLTCAKSTA